MLKVILGGEVTENALGGFCNGDIDMDATPRTKCIFITTRDSFRKNMSAGGYKELFTALAKHLKN
jgi:hypothetical protein